LGSVALRVQASGQQFEVLLQFLSVFSPIHAIDVWCRCALEVTIRLPKQLHIQVME
jgi:hypothetical protein